jgi:hypothetical protein
MMRAVRTRIVLDLDPAADPVAGTVAIDGGPAHPLAGWVALGQAIDQALNAARTQSRTRTPDGAADPTPQAPSAHPL